MSDFVSQASNLVGNCATTDAFQPVMSNTTGEPAAWTSDYDNAASLGAFNQPALGALGVNWMSPQYQDDIDWDAILVGFPRMHNDEVQQDPCTEMAAETVPGLGCNIPSKRERMRQTAMERNVARTSSDAASSATPKSTENIYYVDGTGARAPFGGRSHCRSSALGSQEMHEVGHGSDNAMSPVASVANGLCPQDAYDNLTHHILSELRDSHRDLATTTFPSCTQIQNCVAHYFEKFHPIFPFIRKATVSHIASDEWLLLLAVAAVGSRYVQLDREKETSDMLLALLDAALRHRRYGYEDKDVHRARDDCFIPGQYVKPCTSPSLALLQAGILNVLLLQHSGKKSFVERAFVERHYLVEACNSLGLISRAPKERTGGTADYGGYDSLEDWLVRESEIRVGMMIWVSTLRLLHFELSLTSHAQFVDSISLFEFNAKPLMALDDIKSLLPSYDDLLDNPELASQGKLKFSELTLMKALELVYIEKRLPPHLGEFSNALLVNAIYRNTHSILLREQNPLNAWSPSAVGRRLVDYEAPPSQPFCFPTSPTSTKWRNSACDCLDVLHWPANSRIAERSGSEDHIIMHLHLARLIILTPAEHIQKLASLIISSHQDFGTSGSNPRSTTRHEILEWAVRDRYKARLSIIHCGALFWHIRRYSRSSILEPYAIYLATLVLWAFCTSMQLPEVLDAIAQDCESDPEPRFLHLDRPLDDELVQTFVRVGHKMSAYISNVGNILDEAGPTKILQEGIALLREDVFTPVECDPRILQGGCPNIAANYTWGIAESYAQVLSDLVLATSHSNANTAH
jgi:hypothetical protein